MKISERLKRNITIAIAAVNIILAALTILAAYGGKFNPATTTIPAIMAMTFPGLILVTVIISAIDLFVNRRLALIPLAALAVSIPPLLAVAPVNMPKATLTPEEEAESFTLMSYNVYDLVYFDHDSIKASTVNKPSEDGNATLNVILKEAPDVVCLQECPYINVNKRLDITEPQNDLFREMYPNNTRKDGETVYSRFTMTPVALRQPESRYAIFSAALVDILGHETLVVCVHLESIGLNNDDIRLYRRITEGVKPPVSKVKRQLLGKLSNAFRERAKQAQLLREQIDSLNVKNVIIAGDFNDIPDCFAIRTIAGDDFKSAFTTAAFGPTYTYHANRLFFNIDHVLYRGDMKAVEYQRLKAGKSDHYPVKVKFLWE